MLSHKVLGSHLYQLATLKATKLQMSQVVNSDCQGELLKIANDLGKGNYKCEKERTSLYK